MELLSVDPELHRFGIGSVEYSSSVFGSTPSIPQVATKLAEEFDSHFKSDNHIIIVAHSLGGVIARMALALSTFRDRQHQFITLITLSSPFEGSELPKLTHPLDSFGLPSSQLKALAPLSDAEQLNTSLWSQLVSAVGTRIQQFAAYETQSIRQLPIQVVSQQSATSGVPPEATYPAPDDHLSIAKPISLSFGIGDKVKTWILDSFASMHVRGEWRIQQLVERPSATVMFIEPGAHLIFESNASILSEGRIVADGTKERPIRFDFRGDSAPSAIRLRGKGADDSVFHHCMFSRGRGLFQDKPNPKLHPAETAEELYCDESTQIKQCNSKGGAVVIVRVSRVRFDTCSFDECQSWLGGAVLLLGSQNISISRSTFTGNSSGFGGGAIYSQVSDLLISSCKFEHNLTGTDVPEYSLDQQSKFACGGAVYLGERTSARIDDSVFDHNRASNAGGAIYVFNDAAEKGRRITIASTQFTSCACTTGLGGAVRVDGLSFLSLDQDTFDNNTSSIPFVGDHVWDTSNSDPGRALDQSGVEGIPDKVKMKQEGVVRDSMTRPLRLPPEPSIIPSFMLNRASFRSCERRSIDTIVIHHISAINWLDQTFRATFQDQLSQFEKDSGFDVQRATRDDYKFDWRLCKEILELYGYSAHYMIDRDGVIYSLVLERDVAFHAGKSVMPDPDNRENVNDFSIGIELVATHPRDDPQAAGDPIHNYTSLQYEALNKLLLHLCLKYRINERSVVGHDDISGERAVRRGIRATADVKTDPGPNFDWDRVRTRLKEEIAQFPYK
jgi:predicted outer membrane repeat protein